MCNKVFQPELIPEFNKLSTIDSTACGTHGQCVTYDALGRAVETSNGAAYTEIWYTQLGKTAYMTGSTLKYAYWSGPGGGTLFQPSGSNYWEHKDWLGNARVSSGLGTTIIDDRAFAPYGEMYDNFGSTSANELIFTGDLSNILPSVLYDTENRELNPSQGRWLSPDPAGTGWNQYAYGTDPNTQTDPTGMWITGSSYQFFNEGLRGPFNAGMDVFPGMDQGNFKPVPANDSTGDSSSKDTQPGGKYYAEYQTLVAQDEDPVLIPRNLENEKGEIDPNAEAERALEPVEPGPAAPPEAQTPEEEVLSRHSPEDIQAVRNGACSVDPKLEEAIRVNDAFNNIKNGGPFPYKEDGTVFYNREGLLPAKPEGYYKEFTVEPLSGSNRGDMRVVTGAEGQFYFTDTHYRSFVQIAGPTGP